MFNKPRLLIIIPSLSIGGAEKVLSLILPYLIKHLEVKLILINDDIAFKIPENIPITKLNCQLSKKIDHIKVLPLNLLKLKMIFNEFKPDITLSFMEEANILNIFVSKLYKKNRIIISQRTNPIFQYKDIIGSFIKSTSKHLYKKADKIIVVSKGLKKILIDFYKLKEDKIEIIYNPIKINTLNNKTNNRNEATNYIINVGRLVKAKDHITLLKAFKIIKSSIKDIELMIVGDGIERENIIKKSKELGVYDYVKLTGYINEPNRLVKDARVFLLTSRYEGMPNALLEALGVGCPVVSTDCETGPREVLGENEYGLLSPVGDYLSVAHQTIILLKDTSFWQYMREKAFERAKDFHVDKIADEYLSVILSLV